jgi:hypothetical protein
MLVYLRSSGASAILSFNPTVVTADVGAGTSNIRTDIIANVISGSGNGAMPMQNLAFPVQAGEKIYVAVSAATWAMVYYDDLIKLTN